MAKMRAESNLLFHSSEWSQFNKQQSQIVHEMFFLHVVEVFALKSDT
jgi:hypothetical protein